MKVLQICSKPPIPAIDGGCIAALAISEGLMRAGVELKILTIETSKHPFKKELIARDFLNQTGIESVFVDTRVKFIRAFLNIFSRQSYNIIRFYSKSFETRLNEILTNDQFDIVLLEGLYCTTYLNVIRKASKATIVLRSHNIEYIIWELLAKKEPHFIKKIYLGFLARRLKRYESNTLKLVDGIMAITPEEAIKISRITQAPVITVQVGLKTQTVFNSEFGKTCLFLGSMEWMPNVEGIKWFLEKVWTKVLADVPDAVFYLAGKSMPETLKKRYDKGVLNFGEVVDANEFRQKSGILIVPLLSGGGLKVKIVEAMLAGMAVISTVVGAEGINATNGKDFIISKSEVDFASNLVHLLNNPIYQIEMGKNASKFASKEFSQELSTNKTLKFFNELLVKK